MRINGGAEQPRVLLLSVPYALKAADAQTLGGLPASAFLLAGAAAAVQSNAATSPQSSTAPASSSDVTTSGGTVDTIPLFTTATNVQSSILTQTGSSTAGKIGINTATPASTLDVNGPATVRGNLSLPATGTATSTGGKTSQPTSLTASAYNSSTKAALAQNFRWQAEPAGNNTAAPSGTLNLLYSSGTATPAETGLKINSKGLFTFAAGQTFPGTGKSSVTSVGLSAPTTDFTISGSPVTTTGTLALNWNTAPTPSDTAGAIVKRDSTGSINVTTLNANATGNLAIIANSSGGTLQYSGEAIRTQASPVPAYRVMGSSERALTAMA